MKEIISNFVRVSFCLIVSALAAGSVKADQAQLPERVFAPMGFDSNDNAEVVLYGHFPDTCYQAGPAPFEIRGREIRIHNVVLHSDSGSCMKTPVPWATTVNLGALSPGTYSVILEEMDGSTRYFVDLLIARSLSRRIDDYPYAYVNGAILNRTSRGVTLSVSGTFSVTCMEIAEMRVKETNGVIVILPIVRLRKDIPCGHPFVPIPFIERLVLHPKTNAPALVHIRSMNGQALNQVLDF